MAKKKTRVMLPGGIQGLVHDLQNGTSNFAPRPVTDDEPELEDDKQEEQVIVTGADEDPTPELSDAQTAAPKPAAEAEKPAYVLPQTTAADMQQVREEAPVATNREDVRPEPVPAREPADADAVKSQPSADDAPARGRRPKSNTIKEYSIVKDNSTDSWQLFLDMAQQYKTGGGKLATIYIDESLKTVLDRMKYAGPEKLSTSAILSSIVARFIYDHEEDIRSVLFNGRLL